MTKLKTIIQNLTTNQKKMFDIKANNETGEIVTIVSGINVIDNLNIQFGNFESIHANDLDSLKDVWEKFVNINSDEIVRMYNALKSKYNPVENYDRTESTTNTSTNTVESGAKSDNLPTVTSYATTENSDTWNKTDKTESSGATITNGNGSNTITSHVHGNIGTTKNTDMIADEITLRITNNITNIVCRMFIDLECIA